MNYGRVSEVLVNTKPNQIIIIIIIVLLFKNILARCPFLDMIFKGAV